MTCPSYNKQQFGEIVTGAFRDMFWQMLAAALYVFQISTISKSFAVMSSIHIDLNILWYFQVFIFMDNHHNKLLFHSSVCFCIVAVVMWCDSKIVLKALKRQTATGEGQEVKLSSQSWQKCTPGKFTHVFEEQWCVLQSEHVLESCSAFYVFCFLFILYFRT